MGDENVQTGHEHLTPRGLVLTLNSRFLDSISEEQLSAYIDVVTSAAARSTGKKVDELADELRAGLDEAGVRLSPLSYAHTAEQILGAEQVTIVADDGRVLHGDGDLVDAAPVSDRDPDVHGTEDPDSPDRPAYS